MYFDYAELEDGTVVAYSQQLADGTVQVSIERPKELGFDSALCELPSFCWMKVEGFSEAETARLTDFVHRNALLILRLVRERRASLSE